MLRREQTELKLAAILSRTELLLTAAAAPPNGKQIGLSCSNSVEPAKDGKTALNRLNSFWNYLLQILFREMFSKTPAPNTRVFYSQIGIKGSVGVEYIQIYGRSIEIRSRDAEKRAGGCRPSSWEF
jgi:hypothetical protein